MARKLLSVGSVLVIMLGTGCSSAPAGDWPMWCQSPSRNMASEEKNLPDSWDVGKFKPDSEEVDLSTTRNV
jgi:hypothetical protein